MQTTSRTSIPVTQARRDVLAGMEPVGRRPLDLGRGFDLAAAAAMIRTSDEAASAYDLATRTQVMGHVDKALDRTAREAELSHEYRLASDQLYATLQQAFALCSHKEILAHLKKAGISERQMIDAFQKGRDAYYDLVHKLRVEDNVSTRLFWETTQKLGELIITKGGPAVAAAATGAPV